jgi:hypothetical protein
VIESDLQYVSLQLHGLTYGGWYRVLPNGQMELLALANMRVEPRTENTPLEQALGMLADFVRSAAPQHPEEESNSVPHDCVSNHTVVPASDPEPARAPINDTEKS